MKKGMVLTIITTSILLIILVIGVLTISFSKKTKLSDFSEAVPVFNVDSSNGKYNFDLILESGNYQKNDAVYVIVDNTTSIYAKYILTQDDVETLKEESLSLYLTFVREKDQFTFSYYVVDDKDVPRFEELFHPDDFLDLLVTPHLKKVTISQEQRFLRQDEFDNNDELLTLFLMQSQKYDEHYKVNIFDERKDLMLSVPLTTNEITKLQRENIYITYGIEDFVNMYENTNGKHMVYIKLYQGDELIDELETYFYILS